MDTRIDIVRVTHTVNPSGHLSDSKNAGIWQLAFGSGIKRASAFSTKLDNRQPMSAFSRLMSVIGGKAEVRIVVRDFRF